MRLSKFYSNQPNVLQPIEFIAGLNVVMAEIRLPKNREKDTHNLGKTTLGRLLDFGFLARKDPEFFLFKHFDLFKSFVFFLEIALEDASFVTIRRSVMDATKISFKKHKTGYQDFSRLATSQWDHQDIPFDRAKELLDGLLDWRGLHPWSYRKAMAYLLRTQDDFHEVFRLRKYASKHAYWKPFLAHLLGFDSRLLSEHYDKESELKNKRDAEETIEKELGGSIGDISKIEGLLLLKRSDAEKKQRLLDAFDFRVLDQERTKQVVEEVDERIAALNSESYSLRYNLKKVQQSLEEDQILFNPDEAQRLFHDAGVLFHGQIKRDFQQLIAFNRAITEERRRYLQEERTEINTELQRVNSELDAIGKKRSDMLSFLTGADTFAKYKLLSDEMIELRSDIKTLETQRGHLNRLQALRSDIRTLVDERNHLQSQIEDDVEKQNTDQSSRFSEIRLFFSEIVEEVIDRKALLSVAPNQAGHLEFKAEILDGSGSATSADLGHTYRKLLCIAFDLAVLRARLDNKFPRFVYHDGLFESLDDRKKEKLLMVVRRYAGMGLQSIITLIDSDLPPSRDEISPVFAASEIVVSLHDEGEQGRLFKMRPW
jgi:uncharacterized protein YydD (DUF2326 family)